MARNQVRRLMVAAAVVMPVVYVLSAAWVGALNAERLTTTRAKSPTEGEWVVRIVQVTSVVVFLVAIVVLLILRFTRPTKPVDNGDSKRS